jgi:hypothetical protein
MEGVRQALMDAQASLTGGSSHPIDSTLTEPIFQSVSQYDPEAAALLQRVESFPREIRIGQKVISSESTAMSALLENTGSISTTTTSPLHGYKKWGGKTRDSLGDMGWIDTALHEQNHEYQDRWAGYVWSLAGSGSSNPVLSKSPPDAFDELTLGAIYFDRNRTDLVEQFRLSPVRELAARIPEALRTIRFPQYIAGDHMSQRYGIFGLLHEYSSYYWDLRLRLELFPWYTIQADQSVLHWLDVAFWIPETLPAFAEFRYFILEYLAMEKELHLAEYDKIMADQSFRLTFTDLDDAYIGLVTQAVNFAGTTFPVSLKKKGLKLAWEHPRIMGTYTKAMDYHFWIGDAGTTSRTTWQWNDYYILRKELQTPRLLKLADELRVRPAPDLPPLELPPSPTKVWIIE